jgi:hypothetical protein
MLARTTPTLLIAVTALTALLGGCTVIASGDGLQEAPIVPLTDASVMPDAFIVSAEAGDAPVDESSFLIYTPWYDVVPDSVSCVETQCDLTTHSCCNAGPGTPTACFEGATCPEPDQVRQPCDGAEDCDNGGSCCLFINPSEGGAEFICTVGQCENAFVFCHVDEECAGNQICTPIRSNPWQAICS